MLSEKALNNNKNGSLKTKNRITIFNTESAYILYVVGRQLNCCCSNLIDTLIHSKARWQLGSIKAP